MSRTNQILMLVLHAGLPFLFGTFFLSASIAAAYDAPAIPESNGTYGWSEKQRIRFLNTPLIKKAHSAIAAKDYPAAKGYLQSIIENDPKNNHARVFLVEVCNSTGQYAEGILIANSLLENYPDYLDMYAYKAYMHLHLEQLSSAKSTFEKLLERAPENYKLLKEAKKDLAEIYLLEGEYKNAFRMGEAYLDQEDSLQARLFLSETAIQMKDWPAAAIHLRNALTRDPDLKQQTDIRFKLAYVLFNQGSYTEVEPLLELTRQDLKDKSQLENLIKLQAQTAFKLRRYDEAAQFFQEVLNERFDESSALSLLMALSKAGQLAKGEAKAGELLKQPNVGPDFTEQVLLQRMFFQKRQEKYLEAYATTLQLLKRFEKAEYLLEAAVTAEKIGQLDEAIRLYKKYLTHRFTADAAMAIHFIRKKQADLLEEADAGTTLLSSSIPLLMEVLAQEAIDPDVREGARYELAQIHRARGEMDIYFDLMKKVMEAAPRADFAYEYGVQLYGAKRYDEAIEMFAISLKDSGNSERNYQTCKVMADICLLRGDLEASLKWLNEAKQYGDTDQDRIWQLYMAQAEYQQKKYQNVIRRLIPIVKDESVIHMYIGFSFYQIGMPGLALLHLNEVQDMNSLTAHQKHSLFANRAYLNFDQDQDILAFNDAENALRYFDSDDMKLVQLKVLLRSGAYADAAEYGRLMIQEDPTRTLREEILAMLKEHPSSQFRADVLAELQTIEAPEAEAELFELIGLAHFRNGETDLAVENFTRALQLDHRRSTAYYLRGLAFFRSGEFKQAEADFLLLYDQADTFPASFWGDLGMLQGDLEDYDLGTAALDRSTSFYPYDIDAYEELGYQHMKNHRNREAKAAFKQALDLYAQILPFMEDSDFREYADASRSIKREFTKLDKVWGLQGYLQRTYFDFGGEIDGDLTQADSIDGALVSQAGVGIAYRPPNLGFRNEKEMNLFLRVLANLERDSFEPDKDSYQGGVGLVYKPLKRHNFKTSIERLFEIGDDSENNWLWRNLYGWSQGEKPNNYEDVWLSNHLYGEISYYLEEGKRWIYYLNPKIGYSFSLCADQLILTTPELLGVARYQSNDEDGVGTYYYGGIGANLKWVSPEKAYSIHRWYLDLYAHYLWGRFSTAPTGTDSPDFEGVVFGLNWTK